MKKIFLVPDVALLRLYTDLSIRKSNRIAIAMGNMKRIAIAQNTIEILNTRNYISPTGKQVNIERELQSCLSTTKYYEPDTLSLVAQIFADLLLPNGEFWGRFKKVIFSVLDRSKKEETLIEFQKRFSV